MYHICIRSNVWVGTLVFFFNVIYSSDGEATFSASLLQSSVSHDPS